MITSARTCPAARARARAPRLLAAGAVALLLAGCAPPTSEGGAVRLDTDERVAEVRAARAVLAAPVPAVIAEGERLVGALADVWTQAEPTPGRAAVAAALDLGPFTAAVTALDETTVPGVGEDVAAIRVAVEDVVAAAQAVAEAAEAQLAEVAVLALVDDELAATTAAWDQRGQYSVQVAFFGELAVSAAALAEQVAADAGEGTVPCIDAWPRRVAAAQTVAERSQTLDEHINARKGQAFDEARDEFRVDPLGLGQPLLEADALAATACAGEDLAAGASLTALRSHVAALALALEPADLGG